MDDYTPHIIILGKTGVGKSTTGNILTDSQKFIASMNAKSVTKKCQVVNKGNTLVCDTPGLFDTDIPFSKIALEIQESLKHCPQPHAFLITFCPERMTSENVLIIDMICVIFGEEVFKHAIVVFTHGGKFKSDRDFRAYYNGCKEIEELIDKCDGRVIAVEENDPDNSKKKILDVVDGLSKRGRCSYSYEQVELHKRSLQDYIDTHPDPIDTVKEIKYVLKGIRKSFEEDRQLKKRQEEEDLKVREEDLKLRERQMEEDRKQKEKDLKLRERQVEEDRRLKERQMEEDRRQNNDLMAAVNILDATGATALHSETRIGYVTGAVAFVNSGILRIFAHMNNNSK